MNRYEDSLKKISQEDLISDKLKLVYEEISSKFNCIERISVVLYDQECDTLKTYIHITKNGDPLSYYQAKLANSKSLQQVANTGEPRIINDTSVFDSIKKHHTVQIKKNGYRSSYTYPMYNKNQFYGFIFMNSIQINTFDDNVLEVITPLIHLISAFTIIESGITNTLTASVKTALMMSHHRDPETGEHLARMARYSRLIALEVAVAQSYNLNDEEIEYIYLFAPLHDVGKIAISDQILLKPGKLTHDEFELMKTHTNKGLEIINNVLINYQLDGLQHTDILRNIVKSHHEKINGNGYPDGLKGDDIPIEARIVAVADIFDALTSNRPYKEAWSIDDAFAEIKRLKNNNELDSDCVNAILKNRGLIESIQEQFVDSDQNLFI